MDSEKLLAKRRRQPCNWSDVYNRINVLLTKPMEDFNGGQASLKGRRADHFYIPGPDAAVRDRYSIFYGHGSLKGSPNPSTARMRASQIWLYPSEVLPAR